MDGSNNFWYFYFLFHGRNEVCKMGKKANLLLLWAPRNTKICLLSTISIQPERNKKNKYFLFNYALTKSWIKSWIGRAELFVTYRAENGLHLNNLEWGKARSKNV